MTTTTYQLHGYIQHSPDDGFVTPVFETSEGLFVQYVNRKGNILSFEKVPEDYLSRITKEEKPVDLLIGQECFYAVKLNNHLRIGTASHLSNELKEESSIKSQLVLKFIETHKTPNSAKEIWHRCLEIAGEVSCKMRSIFEKNFQAISYNNQTLVIRTKNESVSKQFRKQYLESIMASMSKDIPGFQIIEEKLSAEIADKAKIIKPNFFYGGGGIVTFSQGSVITNTQVKPITESPYVIGEFNRSAFQTLQDFIKSTGNQVFIITGQAGAGKSRLLLEGYTQALSAAENKTDLLNVVQIGAHVTGKMSMNDIRALTAAGAGTQYVFIDDAHHIFQSSEGLPIFTEILKGWQKQGKKVILSFNNSKAHVTDQEKSSLFEKAFGHGQYVETQINSLNENDAVEFVQKCSYRFHSPGLEPLRPLKGFVSFGADVKSMQRVIILNELYKEIAHSRKFSPLVHGRPAHAHFDARYGLFIRGQVENSIFNYFNVDKTYCLAAIYNPDISKIVWFADLVSDLLSLPQQSAMKLSVATDLGSSNKGFAELYGREWLLESIYRDRAFRKMLAELYEKLLHSRNFDPLMPW